MTAAEFGQLGPGVGAAAFGRALEPFGGLGGTAANALTAQIAHSERVLRAGNTVFGGGFEVADGLGKLGLLGDPVPVQIAEGNLVLRFRVTLFGGLLEPFGSLFVVRLATLVPNAAGIEQTELVLGVAVVLTGGLTVPVGGLVQVADNAVAALVEISEQDLRHRVVGFGGTTDPLDRFGQALFNAATVVVTAAEAQLGAGVTLIGGATEQIDGGSVVAVHAFAAQIADGKLINGVHVSLVGGALVPFQGALRDLANANAVVVAVAQFVLGGSVPLAAGHAEQDHGLAQVLANDRPFQIADGEVGLGGGVPLFGGFFVAGDGAVEVALDADTLKPTAAEEPAGFGTAGSEFFVDTEGAMLVKGNAGAGAVAFGHGKSGFQVPGVCRFAEKGDRFGIVLAVEEPHPRFVKPGRLCFAAKQRHCLAVPLSLNGSVVFVRGRVFGGPPHSVHSSLLYHTIARLATFFEKNFGFSAFPARGGRFGLDFAADLVYNRAGNRKKGELFGMDLWDLQTVRRVMSRFGLTFRHEFGQNFLTDPTVIDGIADAASPTKNCTVLEIGPGIGTLTDALAERYRRVVALEIDRSLIPVLAYTLAGRENVEVRQADALTTDLGALLAADFAAGPVAVCANLPYYVTSPILMKLLESDLPFSAVTVMVQKEFADRLCAAPGGKEYGAITVSAAYRGRAERLFEVPADRFVPVPKVNSTVVRLTLYGENKPVRPRDEELFFRTVRAAFGQRRKTLVNALGTGFPDLAKEDLTAAVTGLGLPADVRGERLSLEQFVALSDNLPLR